MSLQGFNTAESGRKERIVEFSDDVSGARGVGGVGSFMAGVVDARTHFVFYYFCNLPK